LGLSEVPTVDPSQFADYQLNFIISEVGKRKHLISSKTTVNEVQAELAKHVYAITEVSIAWRCSHGHDLTSIEISCLLLAYNRRNSSTRLSTLISHPLVPMARGASSSCSEASRSTCPTP
jgi:hypothetical protein